jgi:hypothetical protein
VLGRKEKQRLPIGGGSASQINLSYDPHVYRRFVNRYDTGNSLHEGIDIKTYEMEDEDPCRQNERKMKCKKGTREKKLIKSKTYLRINAALIR